MSAPTGQWFPRPSSVADLRVIGASGELGADELFDRLCSNQAVEWRHKVGVTSPADGSAKSSTRLLCSHGWVFKTDTMHAELEPEGPHKRIAELLALGNRVDLWHPDKRWFLLRTIGGPHAEHTPHWWPVSACPRLRSLRDITDWGSFCELWAVSIGFALERSETHGVGLDLGPSNFGTELPSTNSLTSRHAEIEPWYLDDETYPPLDLADLALAIVNRIPEWPSVDTQGWRSFGTYLRGLLEPLQLEPRRWVDLRRQIEDVPIAQLWTPAREALLAGIGRPRAVANSSGIWPRALPQLTAVFSDLHANLAAFEAVIEDAEGADVDSWLSLGDLVGYGPDPAACLDRLVALPQQLGVRGNHDHMVCFGIERGVNPQARTTLLHARSQFTEEHRRYLMSLPVELRGPDWIAVHGAPVDPRRFDAYIYDLNVQANLDRLLAGTRRLCFHGHTHLPRVHHLSAPGAAIEITKPEPGARFEISRRGATLVNPGSAGQPRDGDPRASYVIWDRVRNTVEFRRVAYDISSTRKRLRAYALPEALGARLELGY